MIRVTTANGGVQTVLTNTVEVGTLGREVSVLPGGRRGSCEGSSALGYAGSMQAISPLLVKLPLVYCGRRYKHDPLIRCQCTYHREVKAGGVDTTQTRDRCLAIGRKGRREECEDGEHVGCCSLSQNGLLTRSLGCILCEIATDAAPRYKLARERCEPRNNSGNIEGAAFATGCSHRIVMTERGLHEMVYP